MLKILQNIIGYVVDKRFFISILKDENKSEIIADGDLSDNSEIAIHRPIKVRKSLKIIDKLTLGKKQIEVSNENGNLLHSVLSMETASNGDLLGFNFDKCKTVRPKESIFLKPNNPENIELDGIFYSVEKFENETTIKNWQFVLPSYIDTNNIHIQFFFLHNGPKLNNCHFKYGLNIINKDFNLDIINYSDYKFRLDSNIIISDNIMTNIIDINDGYIFRNSLCNLSILRNKDIGSSDSSIWPIYLIGVKVEFNTNYFITDI